MGSIIGVWAPAAYQRPWFGLANALLAELVLAHPGLGGPLATLRPIA